MAGFAVRVTYGGLVLRPDHATCRTSATVPAQHPPQSWQQRTSQQHQRLAVLCSALAMAAAVDKRPDPFVLNSRGNVRASLGDWAGAVSNATATHWAHYHGGVCR